jgi:hypothetical protein
MALGPWSAIEAQKAQELARFRLTVLVKKITISNQ